MGSRCKEYDDREELGSDPRRTYDEDRRHDGGGGEGRGVGNPSTSSPSDYERPERDREGSGGSGGGSDGNLDFTKLLEGLTGGGGGDLASLAPLMEVFNGPLGDPLKATFHELADNGGDILAASKAGGMTQEKWREFAAVVEDALGDTRESGRDARGRGNPDPYPDSQRDRPQDRQPTEEERREQEERRQEADETAAAGASVVCTALLALSIMATILL